jgi:hypothetical protein
MNTLYICMKTRHGIWAARRPAQFVNLNSKSIINDFSASNAQSFVV